MSKIKVQETLLTFDKKQLGRLQKFISSAYFNDGYNSEDLYQLYLLLRKSLKKDIDKQKLQDRFYPEKPYVENQKNVIDNLLTDLNNLVERFIVYEELEPRISSQATWAKARYFSRVQREDRIWPLIKRYRQQWKRKKSVDSYDLFERFELEELAAEFKSLYKVAQKDTGLSQVHRHLDIFFVAQKMKLNFIGLFDRHVIGNSPEWLEEEDPWWPFFHDNYEKLAHCHTPLSDLYYQACRVALDIDEAAELEAFEQLLLAKGDQLPEEDRRNLYAVYRAIRGRQYKLSGTRELIPLMLAMYKDHLKRGVFTIKGNLQASALKLLVNIGIKAEDYSWVHQILKDYPAKRIIHTRYPEEFHQLCTAELLFAQQKFEEAESAIIYRLFEDFNYSLSCDILLIKIYFETQNDLLEGRVRAMELKVRRAKINDFDKTAYLNFISIVRKLVKYLWVKDERRLKKIAADIRSDLPLIQREWLLQWVKDY